MARMRAEKIELGESSLERRVLLQDQHWVGTDPSDREMANGVEVIMGKVNMYDGRCVRVYKGCVWKGTGHNTYRLPR
jgi:hypothetical protein